MEEGNKERNVKRWEKESSAIENRKVLQRVGSDHYQDTHVYIYY